ncbi:hypothetical protein JZU51_02925 [bacterium]|nr:hypothetical protein [bacterium]
MTCAGAEQEVSLRIGQSMPESAPVIDFENPNFGTLDVADVPTGRNLAHFAGEVH